MKKYIDSNIFINSVLYDDEKAERCKEIALRISNREIFAITSVLTWDELVYAIRKNLRREIAIIEGEKFLRFPNLIFIDANKNIISMAQKLIKRYNLKPRDAIHAATAISQGCQEIISEDSDFDRVEELKRVGPREV